MSQDQPLPGNLPSVLPHATPLVSHTNSPPTSFRQVRYSTPGSNREPASQRTSTVMHRQRAGTGHPLWASKHSPAPIRDRPPIGLRQSRTGIKPRPAIMCGLQTIPGSKPGPASQRTSTLLHRHRAGTGHSLWTSKQSPAPSRDRPPRGLPQSRTGIEPGPATLCGLQNRPRLQAGTGLPEDLNGHAPAASRDRPPSVDFKTVPIPNRDRPPRGLQ